MLLLLVVDVVLLLVIDAIIGPPGGKLNTEITLLIHPSNALSAPVKVEQAERSRTGDVDDGVVIVGAILVVTEDNVDSSGARDPLVDVVSKPVTGTFGVRTISLIPSVKVGFEGPREPLVGVVMKTVTASSAIDGVGDSMMGMPTVACSRFM